MTQNENLKSAQLVDLLFEVTVTAMNLYKEGRVDRGSLRVVIDLLLEVAAIAIEIHKMELVSLRYVKHLEEQIVLHCTPEAECKGDCGWSWLDNTEGK